MVAIDFTKLIYLITDILSGLCNFCYNVIFFVIPGTNIVVGNFIGGFLVGMVGVFVTIKFVKFILKFKG